MVIGQADTSRVDTIQNYRNYGSYQHYLPLKKEKNVFWGSPDGFFLGIENRYDLNTYSLGLQFKAWAAFYGSPLITFSAYGGYDYLFDFQKTGGVMHHHVRGGLGFSLIALETDFYFGENGKGMWMLTPKIGWDYGYISIFYGYHLPLINNTEYSWGNYHMVSLTYSICVKN